MFAADVLCFPTVLLRILVVKRRGDRFPPAHLPLATAAWWDGSAPRWLVLVVAAMAMGPVVVVPTDAGATGALCASAVGFLDTN